MAAKTLLSTITVNYFGFTMAVDYSIVLLSIEEMWQAMDGTLKLYGFVFGSYALSQAVMSPLLGYISDVRGLKFALMLSLLFNAAGNIVYGLAVAVNSVNMVLVGRFVAGVGASALALGVVFLTNTSSRDVRGKAIANFKLSQALGYLGGPLFAMAMTSFRRPTKDSNLAAKIFNFYTAPVWFALGNVIIIMLPLVKYCFKNPLSPHMALKYSYREAKELVGHTTALMLLLFLATTCFWALTSDLFTIAFGQYHLFNANEQLWKMYVSAGTSLAIASIIVRLTIHRRVSPVLFTIIGLLFNIAGFACLADYNIRGELDSRLLYYGGVALSTSGGACFFTGIGTYYSQKVSDLSHEARNRRGFFLGVFTFAEAFGRVVGPTIAPLVMYIERKPASSLECDVVRLIPDGCQVANINLVIPVLAGLTALVVGLFVYYHWRHGKCRTDVSLLSLDELQSVPSQGERRLVSHREAGDGEEAFPSVSEMTPPRTPTRTSLSLSSKTSLNTINTV